MTRDDHAPALWAVASHRGASLLLVTLLVCLVCLVCLGCSGSGGSGADPQPGTDVRDVSFDTADSGGAGDVLPGLPCSADDVCGAAFADLGVCEVAVCDRATSRCARVPVADHSACDDDDPCTVGEECRAGACRAGLPLRCDDGDPCTADSCDATGACAHAPLDAAACDDGDPCTVGDVCAAGVCGGATGEACACAGDADCASREDGDLCNGTLVCGDDGFCHVDPLTLVRCVTAGDGPCAVTACVPTTGECVTGPAPNGTGCSDGNPCTTDDVCEGGACVGTYDCAPCTDDASCAPFDDGDRCDGTLACQARECRVAAGTVVRCGEAGPCQRASCMPETGECKTVEMEDGFACADADACTHLGRCESGSCVSRPVACDDDNECTLDICNSATGCDHQPTTGAACEDGDACTEDDACEDGACVSGPAAPCDDGDVCTDDTCDAAEGCRHAWREGDPRCQCDEPANEGACDDGNDCTVDTCDGEGRCVHEVRPTDTACDDGSACTEDDRCDAGECVGAPTDCDDGSLCTEDSCEPVDGCVHAPIPLCRCASDDDCPDGPCTIGVCDADDLACRDEPRPLATLCDDGNACTEGTACDGAGHCEGGTPVDCADEFACTTDFCLPATGCVNEAAGCECDPTVADACADLNDCTGDACVNFACVHDPVADGTACDDDGDACTTGHVCDGGVCVFTAYECPEAICDDDVDDDFDGATDCDDGDCDGDPACTEIDCSDGLDSDRDGATDCDDDDCAGAIRCNPEIACRDEVDNDEDGATDCGDDDCAAAPNCNPESNCHDLVDDDFDGHTDCDDDDCADGAACHPEGDCRNEVDDDFDGRTDCDDVDCATAPNCNAEPDCTNGADDDQDGATDCDDGDCDDDPACTELACLDGLDSDGDGLTDCADPDCGALADCAACEAVETLACGEHYIGTTIGAPSTTETYPSCTKGTTAFRGPEVAIAFTPPISGTATVTLQASYDAAIVVLERACRPGTSCAASVDAAHGNEQLRVEVVGGTTYYVIVDGVDPGDAGLFDLSVACPQLVEDCDNRRDDDEDGLVDCDDPGCATSPACIELACADETDNDGDGLADCDDPDCAATFLCSGCAPRQALSCGTHVADSTAGAQNALDRYPTCTSTVYSGPEHVFSFFAPYDVDATFELTPESHDAAILVLEEECKAADACVARVDTGFAGDAETLTTSLRGGVTYFVVVEGFAPFSFGPYGLSVACSAPPEICDNGIDDDENGFGDCLDDSCEGHRCNDGNACTAGDICSLGECLAPFAVNCDDANDCTDDSCDPATGCVHAPVFAGTPCTAPFDGLCGADGTCQQTAAAGDVIVTEIMKNPTCAADEAGEWFEVYNTNAEPVDLRGWSIHSLHDGGHAVAASLVVPGYGYAVLCRSADAASNGGIRSCAYAYGNAIAFADDGADSLRLVEPSGTEIDAVLWDDGVSFPDPTGASMSLDPLFLDAGANDAGSHWCEGTVGFGPCDPQDRATPGRVNPLCGGNFCAAGSVVACGETVSSDTTALPNILSGYACTGRAQTGGEQVYAFEVPERLRVTALLTPAPGVDLDLDLLRQACSPGDCAGFGDTTIEFTANAFTTYYFVVDGFAGARGPFDLTVTCSDVSVENCGNQQDDDNDGLVDCDDLDCEEDPFCTEFCQPSAVALQCDRVVGGTTTGKPNDITTYGCTGALTAGGEAAYPFTPTESGEVTFTLSYEAAPFLDLYLLDGTCGDTVCFAEGDQALTATVVAGQPYYVVVDGRAGTVGDFVLAADCAGGAVVETVCDDDADGDGDGLVDCRDADCRFHPFCHERTCDDSVDDDRDGLTDCADPDCGQNRACFACVDGIPLACGQTLSGSTVDRGDRLNDYGCSAADESGGERVYEYVAAGTGTVTATLSNILGGDLDLLVLNQACTADGCRAYGDVEVSFAVTTGQTLYLVVDGFEGEAGTFDIDLACDLVPPETCTNGEDDDQDALVDCDDPDCDGREGCAELRCGDGLDDEGDGLVDCADPDCATARVCNACAEAVEIVCGDLVVGTTVGADDALNGYDCADWDESGGERVYRFHAVETTDVVVDLGSFEDDLDVLVLESACEGAACVSRGVQGAFFTAFAGRDYFVVVDGFAGASGAFQLAVGCAGVTETCGDGRDNDGDGATDCADSDCHGNPSCPEICDDGVDNDGDNRQDCNDPDCDIDAHCAELCTTDRVVTCGEQVAGTTVGQSNQIQTWQGCAVLTASGGEAVHELTVPGQRTVTARLASTAELVLFATAEVCADRRCVAFGGGADLVTFQAQAGATYFVVVDGFLGAAGTYELDITCTAQAEDVCDDGVDEDADGTTDCDDDDCDGDAACSGAIEDCANGVDDDADGATDCADADCADALDCTEAVCDDGVDDDGDGSTDCADSDCDSDPACVCVPAMTVQCGEWRTGNLAAGGTTRYDRYPCGEEGRDESGPEIVYEFVAPLTTTVSFQNVSASPDVDLFVLAASCSPGSCVFGEPDATFAVTAGETYYVVVDGQNGYAGDYEVLVDCAAK